MKYNPSITYYCFECGSFTSSLHELIFGNLYRQISIEYNIQVPLCVDCHHQYHHSPEKYDLRDKALEYLKTDFHSIIKGYQGKKFRNILEENKNKRKELIERLII